MDVLSESVVPELGVRGRQLHGNLLFGGANIGNLRWSYHELSLWNLYPSVRV